MGRWTAERWAASSGMAFAVLLVVGSLAAGQPPHYNAPSAEITAFLGDHHGALMTQAILGGVGVVLWVWFLPLLVGLPWLRLYLLCEHTLCPNTDDGFTNTRTTTSNRLIRFLMWNLPYHAEHHLFPSISFHNLPEAHRHLRPHLKYVAPTYVGTHREIIAGLGGASRASGASSTA